MPSFFNLGRKPPAYKPGDTLLIESYRRGPLGFRFEHEPVIVIEKIRLSDGDTGFLGHHAGDKKSRIFVHDDRILEKLHK